MKPKPKACPKCGDSEAGFSYRNYYSGYSDSEGSWTDSDTTMVDDSHVKYHPSTDVTCLNCGRVTRIRW